MLIDIFPWGENYAVTNLDLYPLSYLTPPLEAHHCYLSLKTLLSWAIHDAVVFCYLVFLVAMACHNV